ncbi:MAG: orotate phosphoribosyltransferase [Bacillota bacterium]|nr:orotate phosphoribosyltransferase [Bacillota bacterium]
MTDVEKILKESGAFLQGHFLLSSGKHSDGYVQCAKVLMYPGKAAQVLKLVVDQVKDLDIDVVVGPAMGGVIVSYEIARQLNKPSMFTERENNVMTLRRGFSLDKGAKVLITEDVVTTGKSSLEAIEALKQYGVEIVGIGCLANRSGQKELNGYKLYSAIDLNINSYENDACPLCDQGLDLVKPGSRKKF